MTVGVWVAIGIIGFLIVVVIVTNVGSKIIEYRDKRKGKRL